MSKLKIGLTLLFSALGVFGVNEYYKPRNVRDLLKWKGVQLSSDSKVWKSMFFEHSEELKAKNINNHNDLWNWCEERFKSSNLGDTGIVEEARKYCSDSAKSIMGRIIREGKDSRVIGQGDSEAFKINYLLASSKEDINNLIGISGEQQDLVTAGQKLAEYCKKQERTKIVTVDDKENLANFKKRCYNLEVKTFSGLLEKLGRRPIKEDLEFKKKFNDEKLKYSKELKGEIMELLKQERNNVWKGKLMTFLRTSPEEHPIYQKWRDSSVGKNDEEFLFDHYGWMVFRFWCQEKLENRLLEEVPDMQLKKFSKFNSRCSVEN